MQEGILDILSRRFPRLVDKARTEIETIRSIDALRQLTAEIAVARNEAAVRRAIKAYLPQ